MVGLYEAPHSTVGLIGVIGSGKTTTLNALLGERDLLPSSNDRAWTAVACKVTYNYGLDGYRAEVSFRSRQNFTDELDKLFQNLETKRKLLGTMEECPDHTERQEIEEEIEEMEANTADTLQSLLALVGISREQDLMLTSTTEFLKDYPLSFLGTVMEVTETDRDKFMTKIKPFLDSTQATYDERKLMVWPLIEHVTIYVKSDVLKYGLQLVDLPGLGDTLECRSRVAERFVKRLDITAVVAPACRATVEKTVIGFIKRRQEDEMRMNGKFAQDSLCVVLSKNEDIDHVGYLEQNWIARDNPNLKEGLDRAKMLDKIQRKAQSELELSDTGTLKDGEVESNRREFDALKESLKQFAVSIRNRDISERIQKHFRSRRVSTKSFKDDQVHEDTVEVFPMSARAFHELRHPGGWNEIGFPTEKHTGFPRFTQWLFEVTFKKREKHLDLILNQLSDLFTRIQTWISVNEHAAEAPTNGLHQLESIHQRHRRVSIQKSNLSRGATNFEQSLAAFLRQVGEELRRIEPLKMKEVALASCQKDYPSMIDGWRYKYPDQTTTFAKLIASTQGCILRKNGDYHQSKGRFPYTYQWIDDL